MVNKKMWMTAIAALILLNSDFPKLAKAASLPYYDSNYGSRLHINKDIVNFLTQKMIESERDCEGLRHLVKINETASIPILNKATSKQIYLENGTIISTTISDLIAFYLESHQLKSLMSIEDSHDTQQESRRQITGINIKDVKLNLELSANYPLLPEQARRMILYGNLEPQQTVVFYEDSSLWHIAQDNGLTEEELYLLNPEIKDLKWVDLLGMKLDVTPLNPAIEIEFEIEQTYHTTDLFKTDYIDDPTLLVGQIETLQEGKNGEILTRVVTTFDGTTIIEQVNASEAVNEIVARGTKVVTGVGTGKWIWPTTKRDVINGYLSSTSQYGIGIAATSKQEVYAADSGVIKAIDEGEVLINHKNGYYSRYGDLIGVDVFVGEEVTAGQVIGTVGTASDEIPKCLHFEIRTNSGNRQTYAPNPLAFFL